MNIEQREKLLQLAKDNNIEVADDSSLTYENSLDTVLDRLEDEINRRRNIVEAFRGDARIQVKGENKPVSAVVDDVAAVLGDAADAAMEKNRRQVTVSLKEKTVAELQDEVKVGKSQARVKPVSPSPKVDKTIQPKGKKR